jgi:hypothetical protein
MAQLALMTESGVTIEVECSCGAKTSIFWSRGAKRFIAQNPTWKFRGTEEASESEPLGWTCGKKGHKPCNKSEDH